MRIAISENRRGLSPVGGTQFTASDCIIAHTLWPAPAIKTTVSVKLRHKLSGRDDDDDDDGGRMILRCAPNLLEISSGRLAYRPKRADSPDKQRRSLRSTLDKQSLLILILSVRVRAGQERGWHGLHVDKF